MSDTREKLIKLLEKATDLCGETECSECKYMEIPYAACVEACMVDLLIANGVTVQEWIPVSERLPENFVSVLGYMTDAGEFPPVRECYTAGNAFFFPALADIHPVSHWMPLPDPPNDTIEADSGVIDIEQIEVG